MPRRATMLDQVCAELKHDHDNASSKKLPILHIKLQSGAPRVGTIPLDFFLKFERAFMILKFLLLSTVHCVFSNSPLMTGRILAESALCLTSRAWCTRDVSWSKSDLLIRNIKNPSDWKSSTASWSQSRAGSVAMWIFSKDFVSYPTSEIYPQKSHVSCLFQIRRFKQI